MSWEIESKAWVKNPGELKVKLKSIGTFVRSYKKSDRYYSNDKGEMVRIREDNGKLWVTRKIKKLQGSMEQNREIEF